MGFVELLFVAFGASMDAFAVALCQGLSLRNISYKQSLLISIFFGFFQAFMPLLGYLLASSFSDYIQAFDHYIAFGLLSFLGIRMIYESKDGCELTDSLSIKRLFLLAIATSIDALAIGITFAFLNVKIIESVLVIGLVTFVLSFIATKIGKFIGDKMHQISQIVGGSILILIGLKILLEHLGVINF
ncbi:TPA: manganese efflux pump [bacterium]|nr:manganese efflux pump [bacterium]